MTWYFGGAALITVLFALNAFYVRALRARRGVQQPPLASMLKRSMPGGETALALLPVVALGLGLAIRTLAPGNEIGRELARPWVVVCLVPWTMAVVSVIAVIAELRRRRAARAR